MALFAPLCHPAFFIWKEKISHNISFSFIFQVTMTVDGKYPERWKTDGRFSYLASSALFLGGSDGRENIPIIRSINNLIGCMKKVLFHIELYDIALHFGGRKQ